MTAKRRDAIAAPEMKQRATMRRSEAVLVTVSPEIFEGNEYAVGMAAWSLPLVIRRFLTVLKCVWWSTCPV